MCADTTEGRESARVSGDEPWGGAPSSLGSDFKALAVEVGVLRSWVEAAQADIDRLELAGGRSDRFRDLLGFVLGQLERGHVFASTTYRDGVTVRDAIRGALDRGDPHAVTHDGGGVACPTCGYTWHTVGQARKCDRLHKLNPGAFSAGGLTCGECGRTWPTLDGLDTCARAHALAAGGGS